MTRASAEAARALDPAPAATPRAARGSSDGRAAASAMTGDVKLLLAATALVLIAGLGWLMLGPRPQPYPAVLGYVDGGPPPSKPPSRPPQPPFKLPWWK